MPQGEVRLVVGLSGEPREVAGSLGISPRNSSLFTRLFSLRGASVE